MEYIDYLLPNIRNFLEVQLANDSLSEETERLRRVYVDRLKVLDIGPCPPLPECSAKDYDLVDYGSVPNAVDQLQSKRHSLPLIEPKSAPEQRRLSLCLDTKQFATFPANESVQSATDTVHSDDEVALETENIYEVPSSAPAAITRAPVARLRNCAENTLLPRKSLSQARRFSAFLGEQRWTLAGPLQLRQRANKWIGLPLSLLTSNGRLLGYKGSAGPRQPSLALALCGVTAVYAGRDSGCDHVVKIGNCSDSGEAAVALAAESEAQAVLWCEQIRLYSRGQTPTESVCLLENASSLSAQPHHNSVRFQDGRQRRASVLLAEEREDRSLSPFNAAQFHLSRVSMVVEQVPRRFSAHLFDAHTADFSAESVAAKSGTFASYDESPFQRQSSILSSVRRKVGKLGAKRWSAGPVTSQARPILRRSLPSDPKRMPPTAPAPAPPPVLIAGQLGGFGWGQLHAADALFQHQAGLELSSAEANSAAVRFRATMRRASLSAFRTGASSSQLDLRSDCPLAYGDSLTLVQGEVQISVPERLAWCSRWCRIRAGHFDIFGSPRGSSSGAPLFSLPLESGHVSLELVRDKRHRNAYCLQSASCTDSRLLFYVKDKVLIGRWLKACIQSIGVAAAMATKRTDLTKSTARVRPVSLIVSSPNEFAAERDILSAVASEAGSPIYDEVCHGGHPPPSTLTSDSLPRRNLSPDKNVYALVDDQMCQSVYMPSPHRRLPPVPSSDLSGSASTSGTAQNPSQSIRSLTSSMERELEGGEHVVPDNLEACSDSEASGTYRGSNFSEFYMNLRHSADSIYANLEKTASAGRRMVPFVVSRHYVNHTAKKPVDPGNPDHAQNTTELIYIDSGEQAVMSRSGSCRDQHSGTAASIGCQQVMNTMPNIRCSHPAEELPSRANAPGGNVAGSTKIRRLYYSSSSSSSCYSSSMSSRTAASSGVPLMASGSTSRPSSSSFPASCSSTSGVTGLNDSSLLLPVQIGGEPAKPGVIRDGFATTPSTHRLAEANFSDRPRALVQRPDALLRRSKTVIGTVTYEPQTAPVCLIDVENADRTVRPKSRNLPGNGGDGAAPAKICWEESDPVIDHDHSGEVSSILDDVQEVLKQAALYEDTADQNVTPETLGTPPDAACDSSPRELSLAGDISFTSPSPKARPEAKRLTTAAPSNHSPNNAVRGKRQARRRRKPSQAVQ